jgi:chromosomal replication initiator protein
MTLPQILEIISTETGIRVEDIKGKSRKREIVETRHIYKTIARRNSDLPNRLIAGEVDRHETTAINSVKTLGDWMDTEKKLKAKVKRLKKR